MLGRTAPAVRRDVVGDYGAIAATLGDDRLRGIVGRIHIHVGQVSQ